MMHKIYPKLCLCFILILFSIQRSHACGYDWVGECSSAVHLRINGTLDSFILADCPSGIPFQGLQLGTLRTLSLANAKAITWESCINNVTAVGLKYRIFEQGGGAGNFQTLQLAQDYFTLQGPYTTRYRSNASNIDLAAGLIVGKTYVLEVYLLADIDTIGDDFIPETVLFKNNNGQNYQLTFTYGGPAANPFVVNPTLIHPPNCHGESNGAIGVSVWGDQTGLFYNWSNVNLNFFQQNGIPAGTYTVTVSGINYSEAVTVNLGQPEVLGVQAGSIQPVSCGGGLGSITAEVTGGTAPYQYLWQNGQTTATATFPNSGNYGITVSDAHHCAVVQNFMLPGGGTVQKSASIDLCAGQSIQLGNVLIDVAGVYTINLPGIGGCDTVLTLTVSAIHPGALLENLPSMVILGCSNPSANLCANAAANASYQWSKDGIPATPTPCLLVTAGGLYKIEATLNGCVASKTILSEEHLVPPILNASGEAEYILKCYVVDSTIVHYEASSNAIGAQYEWVSQGQIISSSPEFSVYYDSFPSNIPSVMVTDQFGCHASSNPPILFTDPPLPPFPEYFLAPDLCNGLIKVDLYILGSINGPYTMTWNDSMVSGTEFLLPPGLYAVEITDKNGCIIPDQVWLYPFFNATVWDAPIPNFNTGAIQINSNYWLDYLWDDGSIGYSKNSLAPGDYCVTISDQNLCSIDTCFTVQGAVATQDLPTENLVLYPNPLAPGEWLSIKQPEKLGLGKVTLEIADFQGKIIYTQNLTNSGQNLQFQTPQNLSSGIYTLHLSSEHGHAIGKILLNK